MGDWNPEALRRARRRYEAEHGDIKLEEIGKRAGKLLGQKAPSVQVLSYIFKNGREPRFTLGVALAVVLEADPAAIALPSPPATGRAPRPPLGGDELAPRAPAVPVRRRKGA